MNGDKIRLYIQMQHYKLPKLTLNLKYSFTITTFACNLFSHYVYANKSHEKQICPFYKTTRGQSRKFKSAKQSKKTAKFNCRQNMFTIFTSQTGRQINLSHTFPIIDLSFGTALPSWCFMVGGLWPSQS